MSGFDYLRTRDSAERLLKRFGVAATLRKPGTPTGPAYDPTPGAPSDYPCTVVTSKFSTYEVGQSQGRILVTDELMLMLPGDASLVPVPGDKIVLGGVAYTIIGPDVGKGIETIAPGGTAVLFLLQVRK